MAAELAVNNRLRPQLLDAVHIDRKRKTVFIRRRGGDVLRANTENESIALCCGTKAGQGYYVITVVQPESFGNALERQEIDARASQKRRDEKVFRIVINRE